MLVIGSGPILIGQAAEFDYAGVQACLALRAEGVETILVNSNPATVMTDPDVGGTVLLGPLTLASVTRVIEEQSARRPAANPRWADRPEPRRPARRRRRAGAPWRARAGDAAGAVRAAEDRGGFRSLVMSIGEPVPESAVVETLEAGMDFVAALGAPVVVRPAFTLAAVGAASRQRPARPGSG